MNEPKSIYVIDPETKALQFSALVPEDQFNPEVHITVAPSSPPNATYGMYETVWNKSENKWTHKLTEWGTKVAWESIKHQRNQLLSNTDWTQMGDVNLPPEKTAAVQKYRQALRDITKTFSSPDQVVWPECPV